MLSLDERNPQGGFVFDPPENETPESVFHRAWAAELVLRVLATLERKWGVGEKRVHFELFRRFVVQPALHGAVPSTYAELGSEFGVTAEQVGFRILTARRAYQRYLEEEISAFAQTKAEIDAEVEALFAFLAER